MVRTRPKSDVEVNTRKEKKSKYMRASLSFYKVTVVRVVWFNFSNRVLQISGIICRVLPFNVLKYTVSRSKMQEFL